MELDYDDDGNSDFDHQLVNIHQTLCSCAVVEDFVEEYCEENHPQPCVLGPDVLDKKCKCFGCSVKL